MEVHRIANPPRVVTSHYRASALVDRFMIDRCEFRNQPLGFGPLSVDFPAVTKAKAACEEPPIG
jgi:hypothetical protein